MLKKWIIKSNGLPSFCSQLLSSIHPFRGYCFADAVDLMTKIKLLSYTSTISNTIFTCIDNRNVYKSYNECKSFSDQSENYSSWQMTNINTLLMTTGLWQNVEVVSRISTRPHNGAHVPSTSICITHISILTVERNILLKENDLFLRAQIKIGIFIWNFFFTSTSNFCVLHLEMNGSNLSCEWLRDSRVTRLWHLVVCFQMLPIRNCFCY